MANHPYPDGPFEIELSIESDPPRRVSSVAVIFYDRYGTKLVNADTVALGETIWLDHETTVLIQIKELHLNPDTYILGLWLANGDSAYDWIYEVGEIEIVDSPSGAFGNRPLYDGRVTCDFSVRTNQ